MSPSEPEPIQMARELAVAISNLISDHAEKEPRGAALMVVLAQLTALHASLMVLQDLAPLPPQMADLTAIVARVSKRLARGFWLREKRQAAERRHGLN